MGNQQTFVDEPFEIAYPSKPQKTGAILSDQFRSVGTGQPNTIFPIR